VGSSKQIVEEELEKDWSVDVFNYLIEKVSFEDVGADIEEKLREGVLQTELQSSGRLNTLHLFWIVMN
jgi:hypothetical protein